MNVGHSQKEYNFMYDKSQVFHSFDSFDCEQDAERAIKRSLDAANIWYKQQHILKSGKRLDFVARFDDFYFPIEVKKSLLGSSKMALAAAQANSYAVEIKNPVFIGPIVSGLAIENDRAVRYLTTVMAHFNVGYIVISNTSFAFLLGEKPFMVFRPSHGVRFTPDRYRYRHWSGSQMKSVLVEQSK
jgi:hypothetical protein